MEERKTLKISLVTFLLIIVITIVGLYFVFVKDKDNKDIDTNIANMNFTINEIEEKNNNFENRGIVKIRLESYPIAEDMPYTYLKINIETKEVLKTREGGMPTSDGRSLYEELGKRILSNGEFIELKELLIEIRDNNEYTNFQEPNHLDDIKMYRIFEGDNTYGLFSKDKIKFLDTLFDSFDEKEEEVIKILVEEHVNHSGMPGPDGASQWGTSTFIASDGCIYKYEYDEYDDKSNYPQEESIDKLSKELISRAKKTNKKLTDEELKLVKEYIKNVENKTEEIKEMESSMGDTIFVADDIVNESFIIYNYIDKTKMQIKPKNEGQIHYESKSIKKLIEIVDSYFDESEWIIGEWYIEQIIDSGEERGFSSYFGTDITEKYHFEFYNDGTYIKLLGDIDEKGIYKIVGDTVEMISNTNQITNAKKTINQEGKVILKEDHSSIEDENEIYVYYVKK